MLYILLFILSSCGAEKAATPQKSNQKPDKPDTRDPIGSNPGNSDLQSGNDAKNRTGDDPIVQPSVDNPEQKQDVPKPDVPKPKEDEAVDLGANDDEQPPIDQPEQLEEEQEHEVVLPPILGPEIVDPEINAEDANGDTALIRAVKSKDAAAVAQLIAKGANVNYGGQEGNPLYWAIEGNDEAMVDQLIKAGASVNISGSFTMTLLKKAVVKGYTNIVYKLIKAGANVNATNIDGATALDLATNGEIKQILKGAGAKKYK